jgi:phosphoinositide-3-kinase regulatory subunit 4
MLAVMFGSPTILGCSRKFLQVMRLAPDGDIEARELPAALAPRTLTSKMVPSNKQAVAQNGMNYRVEELNEPPSRLGGVRALLPLAGGTGVLSGGSDLRVRMWDRLR